SHFVIFIGAVDFQQRHTPFIFLILAEAHMIFKVRKVLAHSRDAHTPDSGFAEFLFEIHTDSWISLLKVTARTACTSGERVPAKERFLNVVTEVSEPGQIPSPGFASGIIFILETFMFTADAATVVVVHQIMSQHAAIIAQPGRESAGGGIKQNERSV